MLKRIWCNVIVLTFLTQMIIPVAWAGQKVWEQPLDIKMTWSKVSHFGTIIVGSDSGLQSVNPETGEKLWVREDLKHLAPFDVKEVPGYPILILGKDKGIGGSKSEIEAIDMATGTTLWKNDKINGAPLGVYPVPNKPQVLFLANIFYDKEKSEGVYLISFDAQTGQEQWSTLYEKKANGIPTYLADNSGAFYVRMDLSGYQEPIYDTDTAYLTFKGVQAINLSTGEIKWSEEFKPAHKTYKKSYAAPVIEGNMVYATGNGSVYAFNKTTGEKLWVSKKVSSGLISQLIMGTDFIFVRVGGNFFDQGSRKYILDKPLLVQAYKKTDGTLAWEYDGARGGITNMVYLPTLNSIMFADAKNLIGLDALGTGDLKETFKVPVKFKRDISATDVASSGVKVLTGGIGGLLQASIKTAVGKEREDPPVAVILQPDGKVSVRGQQHLLSFDPASKEIIWSLFYAAPGPSMLGVAMVAGVSAFAVLGYQASYASGGSAMSSASSNIKSQFSRMDNYLDKRFSKASNVDSHAFILTTVTEEQQSGIGIMAVNLSNGETDGQVVFKEKDPNYTVDQLSKRLYFFPKGKSIVAYDMGK